MCKSVKIHQLQMCKHHAFKCANVQFWREMCKQHPTNVQIIVFIKNHQVQMTKLVLSQKKILYSQDTQNTQLDHCPGGGGGTVILTVTGTCRWTGYAIFTVIHIGTGYLNRPNWLLAGYSVYNRVASRAFPRGPSPQCLWQAHDLGTSDCACGTTMFMTGPRDRCQRRRARARNRFPCVMYGDDGDT